jgi:hypothetical protein
MYKGKTIDFWIMVALFHSMVGWHHCIWAYDTAQHGRAKILNLWKLGRERERDISQGPISFSRVFPQ